MNSITRGGKSWRSLAAFIAILCLFGITGISQMENEAHMKISSSKFIEGGNIPAQFTCDGENASPDLVIENLPAAAKSLVLIVDDPDAPRGTFTHWLMWNLKTDLKEIPVNSPPQDAVQGINDFGKKKYGGPCPPSGTHRYYFRLYALDVVLSLPPNSDRKALDKAIGGHVITKATLMGRYSRSGK